MVDITLTFTQEQFKRLEALRKKYNKPSIKDVIYMALLLADKCEDEIEKGNKICSMNEQDGVVGVMEMTKNG